MNYKACLDLEDEERGSWTEEVIITAATDDEAIDQAISAANDTFQLASDAEGHKVLGPVSARIELTADTGEMVARIDVDKGDTSPTVWMER